MAVLLLSAAAAVLVAWIAWIFIRSRRECAGSHFVVHGTIASGLTIVIRSPLEISFSDGWKIHPAASFTARPNLSGFDVSFELFAPVGSDYGRRRRASLQGQTLTKNLLDFRPLNLTTKAGGKGTPRVSIIIANRPLPNFADALLDRCNGLCICADGGANRLWDHNQTKSSATRVPDYIVGDLDSLRFGVKEFYEKQGTKVIKSHCQDTNDLQKAFALLVDRHGELMPTDITIVLGAHGGRFDQTICNIHCLYKLVKTKSLKICLIDEDNFLCVLPSGRNELSLPDFAGETCGLLPLSPCHAVNTSGLLWELKGQPLSMTTQVSSSNQIKSIGAPIIIDSTCPLIWYSELLEEALRGSLK